MGTVIHHHTPLIRSTVLSRHVGSDVLLKMESMQPTGSFKARGIGNLCQFEVHAGATELVASSGGNAGLAVAYSARLLKVAATIVVPEETGERARSLIAAEGASVVVHGASWQEAHFYAQTLLGPTSAYIHPFDHPLIWEGHATLIEEVAETGVKPDQIILSVGGGGLFCGVCLGCDRVGWGDVPIVAVETLGAESFHLALEVGNLVSLPHITSIATTLGVKTVAAQTLRYGKERSVESVLVSDRDAVTACLRFADDHRTIVEPACGAALVPVYQSHKNLVSNGTILVVVCGGSASTYKSLQDYLT